MKKYYDGPGKLFFSIVFIAGCAPIQYNPEVIYFHQGSAKLQSNQCSEAVEDFTKAINIYSAKSADGNSLDGIIAKIKLGDVYSGRSACYKKLGKLDLALEDQKKAVGFYKEGCQLGSQAGGQSLAMIDVQAMTEPLCRKIPEQELVLENLKKEAPQMEAGQSQGSGGKPMQSTLQDILKELQKEE